MSKTDAWMPMHIGNYLGDTMHLRAAEHGAYLLLLFHYWTHGPLPDNDTALASVARCDVKEWRKVGPVVRAFFEAREGRLHQKRADIERERVGKVSVARKAAGAAGAQARWSGNDGPNNGPGGNGKPGGNGDGKSDGKPDGKPIANAMANGMANGSQTDAIATILPSHKVQRTERTERSPTLSSLSVPPREGENLSDPLHTGMPGGAADPKTGNWYVEGWDVGNVFERCMEAAKINPAQSRETWATVAGWLTACFQPEDIIATIRRVADRPGAPRVSNLGYFSKAIAEDCKPGESEAAAAVRRERERAQDEAAAQKRVEDAAAWVRNAPERERAQAAERERALAASARFRQALERERALEREQDEAAARDKLARAAG